MSTSPPAASASRSIANPAPAVAMAPIRFLLVDGCRQSRMRVTAVLVRWGIVPTVACNGAQAVQIAERRDFDFVLMELLMPEMDGVVATARIRQFEREHPTRAPVPIVAHTAFDLGSHRAVLARIGLTAVLPKPCVADALQACLQHWCRETRVVPASASRGVAPAGTATACH